ncbi:MAG: J domain-containing protein [Acidobacteriaceae bacterium]|nr:J domain-containing protein [Acidobacteriaceae bacterium]
MHVRRDPCQYYRILGVDESATSDELKRAFRTKARQFHPDRNPSQEAAREFQVIAEAYRILSDSTERAKYDAQSYEPDADGVQADHVATRQQNDAEPVVCCVCHSISAQPRYVVYRYVTSLIVTRRHAYHGIFCPECGARQAAKASLITWFFGWWGIPWGPIYSIRAIGSNMLGGIQPALNNFRVLAKQAAYFAGLGRLDVAQGLANHALYFSHKLPRAMRWEQTQADRDLSLSMRALGSMNTPPAFSPKDSWGLGAKAFRMQSALAATIFIGLIFGVNALRARNSGNIRPAIAASATNSAVPDFNYPVLPLPPTGEIETQRAIHRHATLAPLKVVTAAGGPNYYVKIVDWETHMPALVFFIRSGEVATVKMPVGDYELRYAAGAKWYGEEYLFGPTTKYAKIDQPLRIDLERDDTDSESVTAYTIELIHHPQGNVEETRISALEF